MSDQKKRQPAGIPIGGEFASNEHEEARAPLMATAVDGEGEEYTYEVYNPTYTILSHNIGAFNERIEKANARLKRAGVEERFGYTTETRTIHREDGTIVEVVDVTLEKPRISAGDWRFDSTHELTENGDVLNYYSAKDADKSPVTDMGCEQCGVKRHRGKVYRVSNKETGEVKQIGGSCLNIFTGVKPSGLWALEYNPDVEDLGYDEDEDYQFGGFGGGQSLVVDDRNMLLATIRASDTERGFISKSSAGFNEVPTSEVVKSDFRKLTAAEATDAERAEIDAVLNYVRTSEDESDYMGNLRTVLKPSPDGTSYIKSKHIGIAASALSSYRRHVQRELERAERAKVDAAKQKSFLAPTGTKIVDLKKQTGQPITARIVRMNAGYENDYGGIPYHVNMVTSDGHVVYWKASSHPGLQEGMLVSIDGGSVKDNKVSDYNGDYETVLTRAKLTEIEEEEPAT